ncbi:MAG TPA: translation initiation factor IF-2, partial [Lachnospiraceae bacterium]|nr:translation initiation factor IF-2 [Lachnospiraceae bacterium]
GTQNQNRRSENAQGQNRRPEGTQNQNRRSENAQGQNHRPEGTQGQARRPEGQTEYRERRNSNYQGNRPAGSSENTGRREGGRPDGNRGMNRRDNDRPGNNRRNDGSRRDDRQSSRSDEIRGMSQSGRRDDRRDDRRRDDGRRDDNRQGGRRDDRRDRRDNRGGMPEIPAPIVAEQKPQRQKGKDNYNKKKEYREEKKEERIDKVNKPQRKAAAAPQKKEEKKEEQIKMITIPESITIQELADKMKLQPSAIVKKLLLQGKIVTVNQEVDYDTAEEIAMEFDCLTEKEEVVDVIEELLKEEEEDEKKLKKRPPVVCVMGHVDHGKTSLLDAIRDTNVTDREAGGITQHIGASVVTVNGEKITFLDTPGHEAFTAMRMRGANSTDIAILVVAADDGVMPQTVEAINHAKAAGIEIVVAINKIDKPSANVERVKQELTEYGLVSEDWGGSTIFVPVSAHTKEGIPELMEMLLLTAEMLELKANPNRRARGLVIEAELDKGKGSVATVLVQKGTLRVGDCIAAGSAHGKVRAMMDDKGRRVKEAGPSMPVEILGLNGVPNAGEVFVGCKNEKEARNFADTFIAQNKAKLLDETKSKMSLDDLFNQIQAGNVKELGVVIKADVQGSVEAIKQSLLKLSNDEVAVKVIHGGVGAINESDVILASASNAIIIGFNVRPDATAKDTAEREGVDVRLYRVIYNIIEDVEAAMKGMLDPVFEEKVLGHAEVRQTFKASGVGTIAGSYVLDGTFERDCSARIIRDGVVIFDGKLASLRRFKDDVKEVKAGYECGFVFERFNDIKEGDQVESYKMVEIPR